MLIFSLFFVFLFEISNINSKTNCGEIEKCAHLLGELLTTDYKRITKVEEIRQSYDKLVKEESYDPRTELRDSKARIEKYVNVREEFLKSAKQSLEKKTYYPVKDEKDFEEINDIRSPKFIRYMSAKQGNDATIVYKSNHLGESEVINETSHFTHTPNANFYLLNTSYDWSAVHVPTPIYDRNPEILRKIDWSNIDQLYQKNRDSTKDLAFQLFCSESGFMRYYPAAPWYWSNEKDNLDLFDCRNTEWYINSATNSKNVMIMLDLSGSMLGQRFEVAKQATEAILGTLSHNDYFNIMSFTKSPKLLDDCNGTRGLLQATMKNKKALRMRMNDIASEGKADYDLALTLAFDKLLNLKGEHHLYTKEEVAMMNITEGLKSFELNEHVLLASEEYLKSVSTGGEQNGAACENIIMLITDGSPTNNKKLLDTLNPNKDVRVFTFLIGEEAIDFNEVREMACDNRGYMVHVANMADVDEKIQYYIKRMSRVVGTESQDKQLKWWTGVYREKLYLPRAAVYSKPEPMPSRKHAVMRKEAAKRKIRIIAAEARSRMFVTTVSYPVIYNNTFMGVAAVTIPLTEIAQKAHPSHIGAKSYFFMLDQNGFIMVHPQLRPIDQSTKSQKINYNSMDLLEVEIAQTREFRNTQKIKSFNDKCKDDYEKCSVRIRKEVRRNMIECNNPETPLELDVLYATDNLERVYPQVNVYYAECINNTDFVIGLAVAKDETVRISSKTAVYDFSKVRLSWVKNETSDLTFKIHPYWRYCFLNDSDTDISKEQAFVVYLEQMVATKRVPYLCTKRQYLVERLLIDLEATENLIPAWESNKDYAKSQLIHLTFFAAASGMIRSANWTLEKSETEGYAYEQPRTIYEKFKNITNWIEDLDQLSYLTLEQVPETYNHFINTINSKSSDDPYYKRAVRMKDTLVLEVNNKTKLWYLGATELTSYKLNENFTIVGQAYQAVYKDKAVLGVAGFEFAYEYIVTHLIEHGCKTNHSQRWCLLLDEHAYVFFSSETQSYEGYFRGEGHVGKFFGSINRIAQRAMELLVEAKYYNKLVFTDHQTSCEFNKTNNATQSGNRSNNPIYAFIRFLIHTFNYLVRLASTVSGGYLIWFPNIPITTAYTSSFHEGMNTYPCSKHSNFYFTNKDGVVKPNRILEENSRDRPCSTKQCGVKIEASYVTGTNLLMVWIVADEEKEKCYSETECAMNPNSPIKFEFIAPKLKNPRDEKNLDKPDTETVEEMMERCLNIEFRKSKANDVCYPIDEDKNEKVTPQLCSMSTSTSTLIIFIILFVKNLLII